VEKTTLRESFLYALLINSIRVTKSRRKGWAVHVAHMGDRRGAYKVLVGSLREGTTWKT